MLPAPEGEGVGVGSVISTMGGIPLATSCNFYLDVSKTNRIFAAWKQFMITIPQKKNGSNWDICPESGTKE